MEVGIDDDFFALGGTSLTAAKVLMGAMLQNIPIEYQDIFDAKTVDRLELLIRLRMKGDSAGMPAQAEEGSREDPRIKRALEHNTHEFADEIRQNGIGNVRLTGATGFLGIHVLKELLDHSDCRVTCLVHGKTTISPESRLGLHLFYYFDKDYAELFGSRIKVLERNIADAEGVASLASEDFDTVINCAASVKHFADFDFLKQVNVIGVENLIRLCLNKKRASSTYPPYLSAEKRWKAGRQKGY